MKHVFYGEFDIETTYQKLIAPSRPHMVKACDFFKQPDLVTPLKQKMAEVLKQKSGLKR